MAVFVLISTHAPRAGSDRHDWTGNRKAVQFQPTLPVRGATQLWEKREQDEIFQPTLPVRGATSLLQARAGSEVISTHAPRAGSDPRSRFSCRRP